MPQALIRLDNFKLAYPNSKTLIEVTKSLSLNTGDVILLTGNSGSGKSSLFYCFKSLIPRVIAGKISGEILFMGKSIDNLSHQELMSIGLLQQNPETQLITSKVINELAFGLENLGYSSAKIQQTIAYYSKKFNIQHLLDRDINTLSGGEKQKIALVGVIITQPKVLLLDEPSAFLDPDTTQDIVEYLTIIAKTTTIIIIEHNLHYFKPLVTRHWHIDSNGILSESPLALLNWRAEYKLSLPMHKPAQLLRITNLNYSIANKTLFKQLDLTLNQAEIIGIVGQNGQGKSTLLKLIAKFIKSKDSIFLADVEINKIKNIDYYQALGLLLQNPENHFLYDTLGHELDYNLNLIKQFNFTDYQQQNPFTLSGGQKRTLSLAIICGLLNRQIYLLDEPTFSQDHEQKQQLLELIVNLQQQGSSFIIISHDLDFLKVTCHKIYKLVHMRLTPYVSI